MVDLQRVKACDDGTVRSRQTSAMATMDAIALHSATL
jgi:hypothetical protein